MWLSPVVYVLYLTTNFTTRIDHYSCDTFSFRVSATDIIEVLARLHSIRIEDIVQLITKLTITSTLLCDALFLLYIYSSCRTCDYTITFAASDMARYHMHAWLFV